MAKENFPYVGVVDAFFKLDLSISKKLCPTEEDARKAATEYFDYLFGKHQPKGWLHPLETREEDWYNDSKLKCVNCKAMIEDDDYWFLSINMDAI